MSEVISLLGSWNTLRWLEKVIRVLICCGVRWAGCKDRISFSVCREVEEPLGNVDAKTDSFRFKNFRAVLALGDAIGI